MHLKLKRNRSAMERFELSVIRTDGCWGWRGRLNGNGYAAIRVNGKTVPAHRFSYETFIGRVPDEMQLDHLCRNRGCTNPAHLEPVSPRENWRRGTAPSVENLNKTHCKYGHALLGDNVVLHKRGWRQCRTCRAEGARRWRERMEAQGAPRDEKGRVRAFGLTGAQYRPTVET